MDNVNGCDNSILLQLKILRDLQGQPGAIDQGPYMVGLYNGLELSISTIEDRDPIFKCYELDIKHIRKSFLNELQDDGLLIGYQANIAMLLHDRYGITDHDKRNNAAIEILNLILDGKLKRVD